MRDCMKCMERATPDSTPRTKFDNDEVNKLLGPNRVPSVSTPMGPLQISSSDQIYHYDDPINVSFGSLADLHPPTGYEHKDLAEEDNPVQVKPLFFHRPSITSTHDAAYIFSKGPRILRSSCLVHGSAETLRIPQKTDFSGVQGRGPERCRSTTGCSRAAESAVSRGTKEKRAGDYDNGRLTLTDHAGCAEI